MFELRPPLPEDADALWRIGREPGVMAGLLRGYMLAEGVLRDAWRQAGIGSSASVP